MSFLKKKEKKEKDITVKGILDNCIFSVREYLKFYKGYAVACIILMLAWGVFESYRDTYYMKSLVGYIESRSPFIKIAVLIFIMFLLNAIINMCDTKFGYAIESVNERFNKHINKRIFKKAANVELACYEDASFYNKYTRALDNTPNRISNVSYGVFCVIRELFMVIFYVSVMARTDPGICVFIIFPIIGNFVFGKWLNNIDQKRYKENTRNARVIDYVLRVLHLGQYAKEMRITGVYDMMQKKHSDAVKSNLRVWDRFAFRSGAVYWGQVQFTYLMIFEGILLYCSYRALVSGTISLAEMTIFTTVMTSASWSIIRLFQWIMEMHNDCIYIQNAREFLNYEEKIPEDKKGISAPEKIDSIEFRNVTFKYKDCSEAAVKNLSFTVHGGERVALVGHNGAGKSTIVKLLLRLYDPTDGAILLNGTDIREYEVKSYRKLFSAAFQDYKVLAMSVLDNITMGAECTDAEAAARAALEKVGLLDKVEELEKGMYTTMTREFDDSGAVFSGGQYQKLAVARALVQNGDIMVFDEPSSALDPIAEYDLFNTIMEETENKTVFLISHRLSSVKAADKILMFENGCLVESDTHDALMAKGGAYADMFIHQAKSYLAVEGSEA